MRGDEHGVDQVPKRVTERHSCCAQPRDHLDARMIVRTNDLLTLLIVAIGARMYRQVPVELDETKAYEVTHPAAAARMNYVMRDQRQWCANNRARLEQCITIALFQNLMSGIDKVLADGKGQRWAQQTTFLHSPVGTVYMEELQAAFNRRLEERS